MKYFVIVVVILMSIALSARGELEQSDLDKIRLIVKAEMDPVKKEVAVMEGKLAGINERFDSIDKQMTLITYLVYALKALIILAVGVPQILLAWKSGATREQEKINQELRAEIEMLKQRIVSS